MYQMLKGGLRNGAAVLGVTALGDTLAAAGDEALGCGRIASGAGDERKPRPKGGPSGARFVSVDVCLEPLASGDSRRSRDGFSTPAGAGEPVPVFIRS